MKIVLLTGFSNWESYCQAGVPAT